MLSLCWYCTFHLKVQHVFTVQTKIYEDKWAKLSYVTTDSQGLSYFKGLKSAREENKMSHYTVHSVTKLLCCAVTAPWRRCLWWLRARSAIFSLSHHLQVLEAQSCHWASILEAIESSRKPCHEALECKCYKKYLKISSTLVGWSA